MLEDIHINDFALIDKVSLEFGSGFTVLSGETGAGKSILIGAISFLLGGKGGVELIRAGAGEARVSGTVKLNARAKGVYAWLSERGIEAENDRILIRRLVKDSGKSAAWVQDVPVTRQELAELTSWLIDIHGQHEHQSLMRTGEHRRFLDSYAGIEEEVERFTVLYSKLVEKRNLLAAADESESKRAERIELLRFACDEIAAARLREGEETELVQEENRLSQYEKLYGEIESFSNLLNGEGDNVLSSFKKANAHLEHASHSDPSLDSLAKRMETAFYELSDIAGEVRSYAQALVFDPARLEEVQERLALFFKLKKKYAASVQSPLSEVIAYAQKAAEQLEALADADTNKKALADEVAVLERQAYKDATIISQKRRAAADKMAQEVEAVLVGLGMKNSRFCVHIEQKEAVSDDQKCGPYGIDDIEFLISANPGNPPKPLAKIASGGELSRVMLALKTVLNRSDITDTLIFDEIDTGIGGEVAVAVGAHLKRLAADRQILCITHLAAIAVYADTQIKIEKSVQNGITATRVCEVSGEKRVEEIARMLSGDAVSSVSLEHARTLLKSYGSFGG